MRLLFVALTIIGLLSLASSYSQEVPLRLPNTGDSVPDITLYGFKSLNKELRFNFKEDSTQKIVVAFWAPWCKACLSGFSKLDSLEKEGQGKVKIILAAFEKSRDSVQTFMARWKSKYPMFDLFVAYYQSAFFEHLFPGFLPYYVGIHKDIISIMSPSKRDIILFITESK